MWHLAQRKRLPFTAVFGRDFFPDLTVFFVMKKILLSDKETRFEFFDAEPPSCGRSNDNSGHFDDTHFKMIVTVDPEMVRHDAKCTERTNVDVHH